MSIKENIEAVMAQVRADSTVGDAIREQSVAAIIRGQGSPEWRTYMERFSQKPQELARLLPTDNTKGEADFDLARTYLVGNGTCGAGTTGHHLIEGVDDKLDENLP